MSAEAVPRGLQIWFDFLVVVDSWSPHLNESFERRAVSLARNVVGTPDLSEFLGITDKILSCSRQRWRIGGGPALVACLGVAVQRENDIMGIELMLDLVLVVLFETLVSSGIVAPPIESVGLELSHLLVVLLWILDHILHGHLRLLRAKFHDFGIPNIECSRARPMTKNVIIAITYLLVPMRIDWDVKVHLEVQAVVATQLFAERMSSICQFDGLVVCWRRPHGDAEEVSIHHITHVGEAIDTTLLVLMAAVNGVLFPLLAALQEALLVHLAVLVGGRKGDHWHGKELFHR